MLLYPLLHPELPDPSEELAAKIEGLSPMLRPSPDLVRIVVENYLGGPVETATEYAMPGLAGDLSGFPPTLIVNSEYDGMRASAERFAAQLRDAGVDIEQTVEPGVYHGHLGRGGSEPFLHSIEIMAERIRA